MNPWVDRFLVVVITAGFLSIWIEGWIDLYVEFVQPVVEVVLSWM